MLEPISRSILDSHNLGWLAPEQTVSLGSTDEIFLVVDGSEQNIATNSSKQKKRSLEVGENDRIDREVLSLEGVYTRKPDHGAPSEVKSEMVMTDIDSSQIPILIDEEIHNIDRMQESGQKDRLCDVAVQLMLVGDERAVTVEH